MKIGHWPLTEDSGSTAYDYSGNDNNGSITGAGPAGTGTVTGPLGQTAYDFDGTDDYVGIDSASVDGIASGSNGTFSFTAWIRADQLNRTNKQELYSEGGSTDDSFNVSEKSGDLKVNINNNAISNTVKVVSLSVDTWTHIAVTCDESLPKARYYVNSVEKTSTTASGSETNQNPRSIGKRGDNNEYYFDGKIADVRGYDRVLSPPEIQYLYEVSQHTYSFSEVKTS